MATAARHQFGGRRTLTSRNYPGALGRYRPDLRWRNLDGRRRRLRRTGRHGPPRRANAGGTQPSGRPPHQDVGRCRTRAGGGRSRLTCVGTSTVLSMRNAHSNLKLIRDRNFLGASQPRPRPGGGQRRPAQRRRLRPPGGTSRPPAPFNRPLKEPRVSSVRSAARRKLPRPRFFPGPGHSPVDRLPDAEAPPAR